MGASSGIELILVRHAGEANGNVALGGELAAGECVGTYGLPTGVAIKVTISRVTANTPRNFPFDVHMDDVLTRHRLPFGTQVTPPGVQPSRHSGNRYHSDQPGTTGEFH